VLRLAEVTPRTVRWLWPGRVPLGKLTVLDGDPGVGKSTVVLDLAARVSRGATLPDDSHGDLDGPASVVLLCSEDSLADTIRPRLEAARADLTRVVAVTAVPGPRGLRPPRLPFDSLAIIRIVNAHAARLLVVDPLMAYLDTAVTAYRDQTVRAALAPLTLLADHTGVAIVVVRHLTKSGAANALYRGGGSVGIIAAARSGLLVALDPHDPTGQRRVLATTKGNLAQPAPPLVYTLETSPRLPAPQVVWHGPANRAPSELLASRPTRPDHDARQTAEAFLRAFLADGPQPVPAVQAAALAAGVAPITLRRARRALGVVARKAGFAAGRGWRWALPAPPPPATEASSHPAIRRP
jgi:hypothetical protein